MRSDPSSPVVTYANDHVAFRVTDIEQSTRFFIEAFGATILTNPFVLEGDFAEAMMEGPPGVRWRMRHLGLDRGVVELFEFLEPVVAARPQHGTTGTVLHAGFQVSDVDAVADRVVAAGGRLIIPVTQWGPWRLTFIADLDGNVIELADGSIRDLIYSTIEAFPNARPN